MVARELAVGQGCLPPSHLLAGQLVQAPNPEPLGLLVVHVVDGADELVGHIGKGAVLRVPEDALELDKPVLVLLIFYAHLPKGGTLVFGHLYGWLIGCYQSNAIAVRQRVEISQEQLEAVGVLARKLGQLSQPRNCLMVLHFLVVRHPVQVRVRDYDPVFALIEQLNKQGGYLDEQGSVAGGIREPPEPRAYVAVVIHNFPVKQLEFVPLISNQDTLEASLRSVLVVIAHTVQKTEEGLGWVNLLKRQNGAVRKFDKFFLH
jgi:hypothetical protein